MIKNLFLWLIIVVILISVFSNFAPHQTAQEKLSYSQFLNQVSQGNINEVTIDNNRIITGLTQNNKPFTTYMPIEDQFLINDLMMQI